MTPTPEVTPPLPPEGPDSPSTGSLLGRVFLGNVAVILLLTLFKVASFVLLLPLVNIVVGLVLLFTKHRPLGKVILLSGLTVALIGLGICGYMFVLMVRGKH